ncbi:MAG TPA: Rv3235 family protein [Nocardioidaceae bacterium]
MTDPHDLPTSPRPHRPPAAPSHWGTVTPLGPRRPAGTPRLATPTTTAVDGALALAAAPASSMPGQPRTPELRVVPGGDGAGDEVRLWAARFAQAVVEVIGGDRPIGQLVRWTSQRVYQEIDRRLRILSRASDAGRRRRTVRPQVRSVHVFHPTPETAEVSVHVRHGQRSRAIAARLELVRGRWQCTALQLG